MDLKNMKPTINKSKNTVKSTTSTVESGSNSSPSVSAEVTETKVNNTLVLKDMLVPKIPDMTESSKGDMNLYSPSKNIRIQVVSKQKIVKSDYTKFDELTERLQPSFALFVSFTDDIPLKIKSVIINGKPIIQMFVNYTDINERFIEMLMNQENLPVNEERMIALENSKKKAKESIVETFSPTIDGFNEYCKTIAPSKVKYEEAKSRWPDSMKQFDKRDKFIDYVKSLKQVAAEPPPSQTTAKNTQPAVQSGTEDEFLEYIKTTALSKITKKEIKAKFSGLSDEVTYVDKTGEKFKSAIKELKESLN